MKKNTHVMYGLITAIVMIVIGLIIYVAGLSFKPGMQYVVYIPFLIGIIMNAIAFSKANNADVTFGNIFGSGFKVTAIVTLISIVWSFIFVMIFPEIKDKAMEMAREQMQTKGLTEEQMDQSIKMAQKFFTTFMIAGILFMYLIVGVIFSLIGAGVAKKKPAMPNMQQP